MKKLETMRCAKAAILALAKIKAAIEAFDRGEINVVDALDRIMVEAEACRAAPKPKRNAA